MKRWTRYYCLLIVQLSLISVFHIAGGIRCYECRSDITRDCGDPFNPRGLPLVECSHLSTEPVHMCFKASQYVGLRGGYVSIRGCAPFNSDTFSKGFQRGFAGTYWRGSSSFSLCDISKCNGGMSNRGGAAAVAAAVVLTASEVASSRLML